MNNVFILCNNNESINLHIISMTLTLFPYLYREFSCNVIIKIILQTITICLGGIANLLGTLSLVSSLVLSKPRKRIKFSSLL